MSTLYDQLGIRPSATAAEVKTAWRALALRTHPDKNPGEEAAAQFKAGAAAWDVLGDADRRAAYDATLFSPPPCVQCGGAAIPNQTLCPRCMVLNRVRAETSRPKPPQSEPRPSPRAAPPPRTTPPPRAAPPRSAPRAAPRKSASPSAREARADARTQAEARKREAWQRWANTRVPDSDELLNGIMDEALLVQAAGALPPEPKPADALRALRDLSSTLGAADKLLRQVRSLFG